MVCGLRPEVVDDLLIRSALGQKVIDATQTAVVFIFCVRLVFDTNGVPPQTSNNTDLISARIRRNSCFSIMLPRATPLKEQHYRSPALCLRVSVAESVSPLELRLQFRRAQVLADVCQPLLQPHKSLFDVPAVGERDVAPH